MSQHKHLTNTRKKITYLVIAMALASTQLLAPGMASAVGTGPTEDDGAAYEDISMMSDDGFAPDDEEDGDMPAGQTYDDFGEGDDSDASQQDEDQDYQNYKDEVASDDGSWSDAPDEDEDEGWQEDSSDSEDEWQDKHADKSHDQKSPEEHFNKEEQPEPTKKVEKTNVIVKPADVRNEVKQEVNQETNVTVHQAVAERQPVVHKKTVVLSAAATQPVTTQPVTPPTPKAQAPVVSESKGALVETGSETATNTAAGLGILGSLGALSILTRRKKGAANAQE